MEPQTISCPLCKENTVRVTGKETVVTEFGNYIRLSFDGCEKCSSLIHMTIDIPEDFVYVAKSVDYSKLGKHLSS